MESVGWLGDWQKWEFQKAKEPPGNKKTHKQSPEGKVASDILPKPLFLLLFGFLFSFVKDWIWPKMASVGWLGYWQESDYDTDRNPICPQWNHYVPNTRKPLQYRVLAKENLPRGKIDLPRSVKKMGQRSCRNVEAFVRRRHKEQKQRTTGTGGQEEQRTAGPEDTEKASSGGLFWGNVNFGAPSRCEAPMS